MSSRCPVASRVPTRVALVSWAALTLGLLIALGLWQGRAYWEYSDGVYSLSARQVLEGQRLYRDFAAAQPPPLYYVGAAALWVRDTPGAIRVVMALCQAWTSLLVLRAVTRLTGSSIAAVCTSAASLLTPWALREHAQLLPETIAAPTILASAMASSRRDGAIAAGSLGVVAVSLKLAFLVPIVPILLQARRKGRALAVFAIFGAGLAVACLLWFGPPLWTDVVHAQLQAGHAALRTVVGLWSQAAWNLLPLLVMAALLGPHRARVDDVALGRSLVAATLGSMLLLATLLKNGSYLTVVVVIEPPLLCLAGAGVFTSVRCDVRTSATATRSLRIVAVAAITTLALQVGSLLIAPGAPAWFTRPFAASGPAQPMSSREVLATTRRIDRECAPNTTYGGAPYLAFVARRAPAGRQPDQFLIHNAPVLAHLAEAARADRTVCERAPP